MENCEALFIFSYFIINQEQYVNWMLINWSSGHNLELII